LTDISKQFINLKINNLKLMRNMTRKNIFLLLIGFSLLSVASNAQKTALIYAEELLERELIDSAIFHFETALGQNPNNSELQLKLADLYRITNKAAKAIPLYETLTKSPSADYLCWYNYAYVLKMEGKYDKCRSVLMQMKSHPDVIGNGTLVLLIEQNINSCDFALDNKAKLPAFHRIANEKNINSNSAEHSLFLAGNQVFYASNKVLSASTETDPNADYIYSANRKNFKELVDAALVHDIKSDKFMSEAADLAPFCLSADKKLLISSSNSLPAGLRQGFNPGNARVFQLSYADITDLKETPKLKRVEFANTEANIEAGYPFLSKDGKTLYFASRGKGLEINYGGFDIYASTLVNGSWTAPRNLGTTVNGSGNEITPFIDNDGVIYFASDGHKGFGGLDIFRAEPKGFSWTELRNLGFGINSSNDDLNFVLDFDRDLSYFCSNRLGGAGDYDIYSAIKLGDLSMMPRVYDEQTLNLAANKAVDPKNAIIKDNDSKTNLAKTDNKVSNIPVPVITENKTAPATETNKIDETVVVTEITKSNTEKTLSKIPSQENVYIGSINDGSSKEKLEGVWVYVINKKNGEERKIKTNKYGEYSVVLDALTTYEIKCSRQGYENFAFEINTGDGQRRTLLSERDMARANTNSVPAEFMIENGLASRGVSGVSETFLRGPQAGLAVPANAYQIQVGVFKEMNPTTQKELSTLANVISEPHKEGQSKVYKLGVFADEAHAKDILSKVQKITGLEKSFIKKVDLQQKTAAERMNSDLLLVYPKNISVKAEDKTLKSEDKAVKSEVKTVVKTEDKSTVKSEEKAVKTEVKNTAKTEDKVSSKTEDKNIVKSDASKTNDVKNDKTTAAIKSEYKVQIGAYKDPSKSKLPDLKEIGEIEQLLNTENGLTYVYLKGYKSIEDAKAAVVKAEGKGVLKPFVVGFKDGKKVDLKEMNK
jgi:hypothetical protein